MIHSFAFSSPTILAETYLRSRLGPWERDEVARINGPLCASDYQRHALLVVTRYRKRNVLFDCDRAGKMIPDREQSTSGTKIQAYVPRVFAIRG
ncbi:hypothetical protein EVG20_g4464 [Dentipellis fragilis]|uniref:Uncharacterized protein n=1 Tax=Dentipellis fragilis TaxID=205917 RepID=A0A4Y9YYH3_9AGAM|nr:hypothetical protein EVG20_g4464 [Dentipellis fragilis]